MWSFRPIYYMLIGDNQHNSLGQIFDLFEEKSELDGFISILNVFYMYKKIFKAILNS